MAQEIQYVLNIDVNKSINSMSAMKQELRAVSQAMQEASNAGDSKAYDQLSKRFIDLRDQSEDLNAKLQPMDRQLGILTNTMGSAVSIGSNLAMIFGADSKSAEELFKTFAKVQAITNIVTSLTAMWDLMGKLPAAISAVSTALKAMGASAYASLGPWGLLALAITAVVTAVGFYLSSANELTEYEKEQIKLKEEQLKLNEEIASKAADEMATLIRLTAYINNENTSRKDRLKAIGELEKQFPGYLDNLDKEKLLAGDISTAYTKISEALYQKAVIAAYQDKLTASVQKQIAAEEKLNQVDEKRNKILDEMNKQNEEMFGPDAQVNNITEFDNERIQAQKEYYDATGEVIKITDKLTKEYQLNSSAILSNKDAVKSLISELDLAIFVEQTFTKTINSAEETLKLLSEQLKENTISVTDFRKEYQDASTIIAENQKLQLLFNSEWGKSWSERMTKELNGVKDQQKISEITKKYWDEFLLIEEKAKTTAEDFNKLASDGAGAQLDYWNKLSTNQRNLIKLGQGLVDISKEQTDRTIEADKQITENFVTNQQKRMEAAKEVYEFNKQFSADMEKFVDKNKSKKQEELDALDEEYNAMVEKYGLLYPEVIESYYKQRNEIQKKYDAESMEMEVKRTQEFFSIMSDFAKVGADMANNRKDAELNALEEKKDKGLITQEQYERQVTEITKKYLEKQKQFKRTQVIIDTAVGIAGLWSKSVEEMGPYGLIVAALTSVLYLAQMTAQLSAIENQKYAKGGLLSGRSHTQGGIKTAFGELEGGEFVASRRTTQRFYPVLNAMNQAGNTATPVQLIDYDLLASKINEKRVLVVASDVTTQQMNDYKVKVRAQY